LIGEAVMGEGMEVVGVLAPLFGLLLLAGGVSYFGFIVLHAFRIKVLGEPGAGPAELEELRERIADLEDQVASGGEFQTDPRVLELEERVDFAERLLASERERAVLPEPSEEITAPGQAGEDL
jgi:hypothetical protein